MKKVIIITLSSEYASEDDFKNAIDNRNNCPYNQEENLIKFLAARQKYVNIFNNSQQQATITHKKLFDDNLRGKEAIKNACYDDIKRLMEDQNLKVGTHSPYASFESKDCEVILVLCDCANIERKEYIQPEDLFLECICDDIGLTRTGEKNKDNIIYIHAEQIGFIYTDGIILDKHEIKNPIPGNRLFDWAEKNKSYFYRISYFFHEIKTNNIFKKNIVDKDFFGETIIDEINKADDDTTLTIDDL